MTYPAETDWNLEPEPSRLRAMHSFHRPGLQFKKRGSPFFDDLYRVVTSFPLKRMHYKLQVIATDLNAM